MNAADRFFLAVTTVVFAVILLGVALAALGF